MPSDRSAKSAIVVPTSVVPTMTVQYKAGWKALARNLYCNKYNKWHQEDERAYRVAEVQ